MLAAGAAAYTVLALYPDIAPAEYRRLYGERK